MWAISPILETCWGCDLILKIKKRRLDFGAKLCTACGAMMILLL
jgi:hypothetical protein